MRKTVLLSTVFLLLCVPLAALAEIREGSIELNPYGGFQMFNDSTAHDKGSVYGLRLGYNFTKNLGVEAAYDYARSQARMYHADLIYHFMPEKSFNPFLVGGIGGARMDPENGDKYDEYLVNVGAGFKYFFTKNIALRADVRDMMIMRSSQFHNIAATAGIVFAFGGKTAKPAAEPPPPSAPKPEPAPIAPPPAPKPEPAPVAPPPAPTPPPPPPAPAPEPEPVKIILEDIHFDFDKATLTTLATQLLDRNIKTLKENPGVAVQIEGHACAHGAEDYNMALSERRANAVKEYLVKAGVAADRLTTISYGETRLAMPEVPTPRNKESKEAKANRRVHFEVVVK